MVFCDFGMSNRGLEYRGVRENWSGGCSEGKRSGIGLWLGWEVGLGDFLWNLVRGDPKGFSPCWRWWAWVAMTRICLRGF